MHQETKNFVTCFIMIFAKLQWSGTETIRCHFRVLFRTPGALCFSAERTQQEAK